jgi:hypothetical protein
VNTQFLLKLAITVALVLLASALARRTGWLGALVASLPLTSLLVLAWLYHDTRDAAQVADLSMGIFWFVLGSLPFFVVLALTLRQGWHIGLAIASATVVGFAGVSLTQWLLTRGGA